MTLSPENKALVEDALGPFVQGTPPADGYNRLGDHALNKLLDAAREEGRESILSQPPVAFQRQLLSHSDDPWTVFDDKEDALFYAASGRYRVRSLLPGRVVGP